jgi:hypothetical protein
VALDLATIVASAPQLLRDMPLIINIVQLVFYLGLAMTFGGYIMRGYGGFISGPVRLVGRLVFGFLAVVGGLGISWLLPYFSDVMIYRVMQALFLNVIIGGIISTIVLFAALRMVSHNIFNIPGIEHAIKRLEDLRKKALEVERKERTSKRQGIRHPVRFGGVVVLAVFLVISLMGFTGFPNPMEELGFSQRELNRMADQMDQINDDYGDRIGEILSDECSGVVSLLSDQDAISGAQPYRNTQVQDMVEDEAGEAVQSMFIIDSVDDSFVLAVTDNQTCIATMNTVCLCQTSAGLQ